MEIPDYLKKLYKHWKKHAVNRGSALVDISLNRVVVIEMLKFSTERMKIWQQKEQGIKPPWTVDPILGKYRFCNIYRELDRQTIEYHQMLNALREDFPVWLLNMFFCRMICQPATVRKTGLLSFDEKNNQQVYKKLMSLPSPKYGTAYIFPISTILNSDYPTREKFLCFYLPSIIKKVAAEIMKFKNLDVFSALEIITPLFGFNHRFLWTEVLIDTAYQYPELLNLFGKFPFGPGSLPTLKKLNPSADPDDVCLALLNEKAEEFPFLEFEGIPVTLSAENWEGVCCEFRKYSNLKQNNGRKRIYFSNKV